MVSHSVCPGDTGRYDVIIRMYVRFMTLGYAFLSTCICLIFKSCMVKPGWQSLLQRWQ